MKELKEPAPPFEKIFGLLPCVRLVCYRVRLLACAEDIGVDFSMKEISSILGG
jgi:hypothetical protein